MRRGGLIREDYLAIILFPKQLLLIVREKEAEAVSQLGIDSLEKVRKGPHFDNRHNSPADILVVATKNTYQEFNPSPNYHFITSECRMSVKHSNAY